MKKIASIILAVLATIGFTVGVTGCSEKAQTAIKNVGGMIAGAIEENGISLKTVAVSADEVAATAESAIEVTATITPATATNKKVTYSVAWLYPNNSWATNNVVTDTVSVTQATTGSLTVTVTCLRSFDTPIILTCASDENPDVKATLQLDYGIRVETFGLKINNKDLVVEAGTVAATDALTFDVGLGDEVYLESFIENDSIGTVEGASRQDVSIRFTDGFVSALNTETGLSLLSKPFSVTSLIEDSFYLYELLTLPNGDSLYGKTAVLKIVEEFLCNAITEAGDSTQGILQLIWATTADYSSSTFTRNFPFTLNAENFATLVQSVSLSESAIVF